MQYPKFSMAQGGIGFHQGNFFVVGGLPNDISENYVYEYDGNFKPLKRHVITSGHTHLGIQTAAFVNGYWWFGCYGSPKITLVTDTNFKMVGRYTQDCSLGVAQNEDGRMWVASGVCRPESGCTGKNTISHCKSGKRVHASKIEFTRRAIEQSHFHCG